MKRLLKKSRMTIRFTTEQAREIAVTAKLASEERGEVVDEATLFREVGMAGVRSMRVELERKAAA